MIFHLLGLVTQIAANHEQELQCYLHELNTVKGRVSTQLEVYIYNLPRSKCNL